MRSEGRRCESKEAEEGTRRMRREGRRQGRREDSDFGRSIVKKQVKIASADGRGRGDVEGGRAW